MIYIIHVHVYVTWHLLVQALWTGFAQVFKVFENEK